MADLSLKYFDNVSVTDSTNQFVTSTLGESDLQGPLWRPVVVGLVLYFIVFVTVCGNALVSLLSLAVIKVTSLLLFGTVIIKYAHSQTRTHTRS